MKDQNNQSLLTLRSRVYGQVLRQERRLQIMIGELNALDALIGSDRNKPQKCLISDAQKRDMVDKALRDPKFALATDRVIALHCCCSHPFVAARRKLMKHEQEQTSREEEDQVNDGDGGQAIPEADNQENQ